MAAVEDGTKGHGCSPASKAKESCTGNTTDTPVIEFPENGRRCSFRDDESICSTNDGNIPRTSTPVRTQRLSGISNSSSGLGTGDNISTVDSDDLNAMDVSQNSGTPASAIYNVPILGYEVMEERARFTVFKIRVEHKPTGHNWFVFRRYTDFVRLNKKLGVLFKGTVLSLPPKRWFGDNFDPFFLEERMSGLQTYITSILRHQEISHSKLVRDFFCLDDPPDPHDSIEELRALWESLEEKAYRLRCQIREKDNEIQCLHARIALLKSQLTSLLQCFKSECGLTTYANAQTRKHSSSSESLSTRPSSFSQLHELNLAIAHMIEKSLVDANDKSNLNDENDDIEVGFDATLLCSERYSSCSSLLNQQDNDAKLSEKQYASKKENPCVRSAENCLHVETSAIGGAKMKYTSNKIVMNRTEIKKQQEQTIRTCESGTVATN